MSKVLPFRGSARDHRRGPGGGGNTMGGSDSDYQFGSGIGEDEVARLELQGGALAPATRMIFAEAGIRPGMRVLDLGCGAGDVTFVAAGLVGSRRLGGRGRSLAGGAGPGPAAG